MLVGAVRRGVHRRLREPRSRSGARRRTRCGSGQPRCRRADTCRQQGLLQDAVQDREGEMLWPLTGRRHLAAEQAQRLADVRQKNPESETWLALVEAALAESQDAKTWDAAVPAPVDGRPARAPLLHGAQVGVHRRSATRFVRQLSRLAGLDGGGATHRLDALDLLEAAIRQDDARIDALATSDPSTLRVVAQVAAVPLLRACARTIGSEIPPAGAWWEGYCPLCGAWPTLAEFRGLER